MQSSILKNVLFVLFLILLACPLWQYVIPVFHISKLKGAYVHAEKKPLNIENWFSAEYQHSIDEFLIINNPLGPFFIRVKNQLEYTFFDKLNISKGVLGKENYMYEKVFIDTYYGRDFIGEVRLREYVSKMKFIQDTLSKLNKKFIYIHCPGKGTFYPEYIPDSLKNGDKEQTNYLYLIRLMKEYGVNYIDFTPVFLKAKKESPHPLFTHTGIHWSTYSTVGVMDSIHNYIEDSMHLDLPEIIAESYEIDYAREPDNDLEYITNLFFRISNVEYAYPKIIIESPVNKDLPIVCMVADSYLGNLYHRVNFFDAFNKESTFWFYNCSVFSSGLKDPLHPYQLDQNEVIDKSQIIILGCTEPNLAYSSWSFIDDMYDTYKNGIKIKEGMRKRDFMSKVDNIKNNLNEIQIEKAIKKYKTAEISVDSAKIIFSLWEAQFANLNKE